MSTQHLLEQEEVMAYLDGELPADLATAAMTHLEQCSECNKLSADFRSVSQKLMTWEVEPRDERMARAIAAALKQGEQEPAEIKIVQPRWRDRVMVRRLAWAGAAVVCVVLGFGISLPTLMRRNATDMAREIGLSGPIALSKDGSASPAGSVSDKERQFDRVQQSAKLQSPPPAAFAARIRRDESESASLVQTPSPATTNSIPLNGRNFSQLIALKPGVASDQTAPSGPMVIRTAGLTLSTKNFDEARARLDEILKRHHGYIGELNVNTPTGSGRGFTASLRLPSNELDAALLELRKLGRVEAESQNGQEVSSQYVDLVARLTNARHTEERLTALLRERTGKLSDVLAVENEISRVRGEIEQMEAERKNLANQVNFATVNATVNEDYQAQLQVVPISTATQIRNAAVEGYRSMVDGLIGTLLFLFSYAPSLILWGLILFFPLRAIWRRVRPKISKEIF